MRGEPLVEIKAGRELDELAQVGFGHFPLQDGGLQVELVIRVTSAKLAGHGRVASSVAHEGPAKEGRDESSPTGQRDGAGEPAEAQTGPGAACHSGYICLLLPSRLPTKEREQKKKNTANMISHPIPHISQRQIRFLILFPSFMRAMKWRQPGHETHAAISLHGS